MGGIAGIDCIAIALFSSEMVPNCSKPPLIDLSRVIRVYTMII